MPSEQPRYKLLRVPGCATAYRVPEVEHVHGGASRRPNRSVRATSLRIRMQRADGTILSVANGCSGVPAVRCVTRGTGVPLGGGGGGEVSPRANAGRTGLRSKPTDTVFLNHTPTNAATAWSVSVWQLARSRSVLEVSHLGTL